MTHILAFFCDICGNRFNARSITTLCLRCHAVAATAVWPRPITGAELRAAAQRLTDLLKEAVQPRAAGHRMSEPKPRRIVHQLGDDERNAMWQCDHPTWPAFYAWHPEHEWLYCTRGNTDWRPSTAGSDTITAKTIAPGGDISPADLSFTEIVRFFHDRTWYWAGHSQIPIELPDSVEAAWHGTTNEQTEAN